MSSIRQCDLCHIKQKANNDGWASISLHGHLREFGFESLFQGFDLCPACTKNVVPAVKKILKIK
jgi:hypothetical protein